MVWEKRKKKIIGKMRSLCQRLNGIEDSAFLKLNTC